MMTPEILLLITGPMVLASIYCWDYGMDLLVPVAAQKASS